MISCYPVQQESTLPPQSENVLPPGKARTKRKLVSIALFFTAASEHVTLRK